MATGSRRAKQDQIEELGDCCVAVRAVGVARVTNAGSPHCSNRNISSCSDTVSNVPVPAGICINGFALSSNSQTLG